MEISSCYTNAEDQGEHWIEQFYTNFCFTSFIKSAREGGLWSVVILFIETQLVICRTQDVLTDSWRRAIDESKHTAAAFLDISKAFDCVNHDILLSKMACYGVLENSLVWFTSNLSCRRQQVCLQEKSSTWGEIHVGVPHVSILGPLLFSIYVNDLYNAIKICDLNFYADDMELHCSNVDLSCVSCVLSYIVYAPCLLPCFLDCTVFLCYQY